MNNSMKSILISIAAIFIALPLFAVEGVYTNVPYVPIDYRYSVLLGWTHSPGTNVAGYNIYYGTNGPRQYNFSASFGYVTNAAIDGLVGGRQYFFTATAKDKEGLESEYSNEVSWTTPAVPIAPTNLSLLSASVETSTNLTDWMTITNVPMIYVGTTNGVRYYRTSLSLK